MAVHLPVQDRPAFTSAVMASNTYTGDASYLNTVQCMGVGYTEPTSTWVDNGTAVDRLWSRRIQQQLPAKPFGEAVGEYLASEPKKEKVVAENKYSCRLVRVIVVDPHESVPMASRVLHMGDEKITDATDEELFFEIAADLNAALKAHNEKRVEWTEKKNVAEPDKAKKLEAARLRDLRMTVVTIATF